MDAAERAPAGGVGVGVGIGVGTGSGGCAGPASAAADASPAAGAAVAASAYGDEGSAAVAALHPADARALAERARVAAASAAERAECEARYAAACAAAAAAAGAPAPFRGPAADSPLGERFLDVVALVSANGFALDVRPARFLCGLTFRLGARRADGSLDRAGFRGGTANMLDCALRLQAPWLEAARRAPREVAWVRRDGLDSRTTSLMRAVFARDERRVRELLAAGAPLHCVDCAWRTTALHFASEAGDARVVSALLGTRVSGAIVDARDSDGFTPLVVASVNGHEGVVRVLLANGAQQGLLGKAGRTVLHFAAASGHAGVVRLLCAAPAAPLDARDGDGCSPLIIASRNGCEGAVRELLARGARLDVSDRAGWTALHRAAEYGRDAVIAPLCAAAPGGSQVDARSKFGHSPLMVASKNGREGAVRALLACGARLEPHDSVGWTALHMASDGGHAGVVELLCAAPGARADARDDNGNTPLIIASISGREGAVRALLACGARQELQGQHGETALHWAAENGRAGVVELLCAAPGAALALALRDRAGRTPLACAVERRDAAVAAALRARGGDA